MHKQLSVYHLEPGTGDFTIAVKLVWWGFGQSPIAVGGIRFSRVVIRPRLPNMGESGLILLIGCLMAAGCVLACLKTLAVEADYQRQLFSLIRDSDTLKKHQKARLVALRAGDGGGEAEEAEVVETVVPEVVDGVEIVDEVPPVATAA